MEEVCERANLKEALRQVRSNKGSAGVYRMTVDQLGDYLKQHWPAIREQLLNGTCEPKPVRRVEIPKPDGGVRKLGIPTRRSTVSTHAKCYTNTDSATSRSTVSRRKARSSRRSLDVPVHRFDRLYRRTEALPKRRSR
jgi:retron-type reverse transcriptase